MAPTPEETVAQEAPRKIERPLTGDEVVISGMSGIFPKSDSVFDFMKNLYDQVDMVSSDDPRWVFNHPEVPKHLGKVNGMGKFDAQFFRVHFKQACTMEPMSRKLLEHAYGAIFDSGINPLQLRGRKVGIFIGSTFSESEKIVIYENVQRNGFGITGCNKAMYANRISYWIDGKGPSYALDLACASSTACLEHAYRSISTGQCDAAIVGGCNLCMHPNVSLNLKRAGLACLDGKTKCYNKNGDGYVRSDAINVIFLQKAKDAKRIYSEVYYAKGNYTLKQDDSFLPIRDPKDITDFLEAFYSEIDVSPEEVEYIEGSGAALAEADTNELEAIGRVFAKEKPVKVGCVKSNMGNSEPASGVCALTKACLAYQKGEIPGNIHYYEPLSDVAAVKSGAIQILQENCPFNRGFVALNSFSYTGANVHVLLKGRYKKKDPERYKTSIPYLVLVSGRQDSCITKVLNILKSQPVDPEQIGLLHSIFESDIPGHMSRGYTIIENNETNNTTTCLSQNVEYCPGLARPVWFVYSGMGSQWASMGAELMRIPIFAAAIERCHKVLQPKGIDIVKILTEPDKTIYDNILNSFVGIAAVQIGLTDILTSLGIVPDNIIGHSVGELGCAYADGCFTAEEMILSAYSRGLVSIQTSFIKGSMAAVGLGYSAVLPLCPPEIEVACHNSNESSTISGPADVMKEFVSELTGRGVFAKEVPCSNIAYHSRYIADAGPGLLKYLSEVITDPKPRSAKWLSTSVPQDKWQETVAQLSSAEYHTNNLLNPVLFEETSKLIPGNAIVIEIAPHGLLQAIIKRSLSECLHVPLTRRGHSDPVKFLLEGVGKLYGAGLNPKVYSLYPKIEFPVSTETSLLSHFVEWEHSENWPQARYNSKDRVTGQVRDFVISIHDDDYKYFEGHVRNGNYVFPEAALLVLVWETFGMAIGINYKDLSVIFQDVQFYGEAVIRQEDPLKLAVMINKGNDKFEVSYKNTCLASGYIIKGTKQKIAYRTLKCETTTEQIQTTDKDFILSTKDIYKMLHLKGFNYRNEFQSLHSSNINRDEAIIKWNEEWVTFLDAIIQFNVFSRDFDGVSSPHLIKKITIDVNEHKETVNYKENNSYYNAKLDSILAATRCGGVELDGIIFNDKPKTIQEINMLQSRTFVPHYITGNIELETALYIHFQIVSDNVIGQVIKVRELVSQPNCDILSAIKNVSTKLITAEIDIQSYQIEKMDPDVLANKSKIDVFVVDNLLGDEKKMRSIYNLLTRNTFVMALEQSTTTIHSKYKLFNVISAMSVGTQILILLNKADCGQNENVTYIPIIHDNTFSWVPKVQYELEKTRKVVLVAERQPICGILGLVKNLKERYPNKLSCLIVNDYHAPSFSPDNNIFKEQIQKKLSINILRKGLWGGYYYIPSEMSAPIQNVTLSSREYGNLDSLNWEEATTTQDNNNLVQVCYAGLNQKDIQKAMGKFESDKAAFGMDFSGIDSNGDKVMGLVSGGAIGSTIVADLDLTWPVPEHWTLEDAATVPLPYALAYYCLAIRGYFNKGMRILVTGGAGALGQAIISICLANDCEVFTTVGDEQKKKFLLQLFPGLKEENIGNSSDEYYKKTVLENTNGEGCPLVINCLSGSMRETLMGCIASEGTFLDISEQDMRENKEFGMRYLILSMYKGVQLSSIFRPENIKEKKLIQSMIAEGINNGTVKPLSRIVYSPSEVSRAFRLVSAYRHRGRVLIRMRDPIVLNKGLEVVAKTTYSSTASYAVVCDDSEIGIELANRLITNGARKLIVHIKPHCIDGYFKTKLALWRKLGVTVNLLTDNLNSEKACADFLTEGSKLGPLHGIFVVHDSNAVVKKDFIEQEEFIHKFKETSLIAVNLDLISRNVCSELSHFVVVTRAAYGAVDDYVNTVADSICQSRNEIGLPALVFHIELLDELDASTDDIQSKLLPQTVPAVLNALEASLKLNYTNVVSYNIKKPTAKDFNGKITRILGLKNIDNINENFTLKDLLVSKINIEEIKKAIKDKYQVSYTNDIVEQMTIERLKNLHNRFSEQHTNFDCGLGAFYTYIDKDECLATEPVIAMPTKLSNATQNEEEIDPKETYIMLIPGFEGHHRIFQSVSERLKVQAMTLQLGPDVDNDSIRDIAADLLKLMQKRFELKSKFYFMGYSFGVNVALELAALMEKEGHVGIVYCLDSSPDALRAQLDAYLGNLTDAQLQDTIVEHMYRLMSGTDSTELKRDLEKSTDWQQKVEACVKRLRGLVKYSHQYQRSILQTAYKRILLARDYEPDFKLESELVLMRGVPHPRSSRLSDDYNLYKYTKQPVRVFDLKTDHALAPSDCRVSNIINKLFDPVILEEFKNKNLCETYLADPFKIL